MNTILGNQISSGVYFIIQVLPAHVTINTRAPVTAITCTAAIINIQYSIAFIGQQVVKKIFAKIRAPAVVYILQIAGSMHKYYGCIIFFAGCRFIQAGMYFLAIAGSDGENF